MKRKIMDELIKWKQQKGERLPLILYGARQVGKTYILEEFGRKYYKDYVYINFEQMEYIREIFEKDLIPDKIILNIERYLKKEIIPEQTLIIFDEIQASEKALTSLKYFAEQASEYHIVAAGSLLGVAINREKFSFPVGKVKMINLYPLDFEEFLWEMNEEILIKSIKESIKTNESLLKFEHERALELYREYLIIGGMPAAIKNFSKNKDFKQVREIQYNILNSYIADMAKYTTATESVKIRTAYDSVPAQLAKENKKFQYKLLKKGASSSNFGVALEWLDLAKIIIKCKKICNVEKPLEANIDLSSFKIYMGDVGLLTYKTNIAPEDILLESSDINQYKGAIIENYIAAALQDCNFNLYYWESEGKAEVDFITLINNKIIPIEVKSSNRTRSRSLNVYMERYKPDYAIRLSTKNFGFENNVKSIPLYAIFALGDLEE